MSLEDTIRELINRGLIKEETMIISGLLMVYQIILILILYFNIFLGEIIYNHLMYVSIMVGHFHLIIICLVLAILFIVLVTL